MPHENDAEAPRRWLLLYSQLEESPANWIPCHSFAKSPKDRRVINWWTWNKTCCSQVPNFVTNRAEICSRAEHFRAKLFKLLPPFLCKIPHLSQCWLEPYQFDFAIKAENKWSILYKPNCCPRKGKGQRAYKRFFSNVLSFYRALERPISGNDGVLPRHGSSCDKMHSETTYVADYVSHFPEMEQTKVRNPRDTLKL